MFHHFNVLNISLGNLKTEIRELSKQTQKHTVATWTFTFHRTSGFVWLFWKADFKQLYRLKVSIFWPENSDLSFSFSFYFLLELSKYSAFCTLLKYLNCNLMQKCVSNNSTLSKKHWIWQLLHENRRKMRLIDLNFQIKRLISLASRLVWNWLPN